MDLIAAHYAWRIGMPLVRASFFIWIFGFSACVSPSVVPPSAVEIASLSAADTIIALTHERGGITFDLEKEKAFDEATSAFAVSLRGGVTIPARADDEVWREALKDFIAQHRGSLSGQNQLYIGTWIDEESDLLYIDRTRILIYTGENRTHVLEEARELAHREAQKAIYDFGRSQVISIAP